MPYAVLPEVDAPVGSCGWLSDVLWQVSGAAAGDVCERSLGDRMSVSHLPQLVGGLLISDLGSQRITHGCITWWVKCLAAGVVGWSDVSPLSAGAAGSDSHIRFH